MGTPDRYKTDSESTAFGSVDFGNTSSDHAVQIRDTLLISSFVRRLRSRPLRLKNRLQFVTDSFLAVSVNGLQSQSTGLGYVLSGSVSKRCIIAACKGESC